MVARIGEIDFALDIQVGIKPASYLTSLSDHGGNNAGPGPFSLLLSRWRLCTAITLRMYAQRKGVNLTAVDVAAKLFREDSASHIDRNILLHGDLDEAQTARLLEISEKTPVTLTLKGGIEIRTTLESIWSRMMRNELFEFEGEQGSRLIGKLDLPDGPPHSYALFAHCFTCTKESLAAVRIGRALAGQGIGVLRFDFTGLGQSGGDFADSTFSGSVKDVLAAARAMGDAGIEPALLIGHSLGGAAVLAAAADLPNVKAIATIGAPFDVQHVTDCLAKTSRRFLSKARPK